MSDTYAEKGNQTQKIPVRMIVIAVILGLVISTAISFFFDWNRMRTAIMNLTPLYVVIPFGIYVIMNVIDSLRLKLVLAQFKERISFREAFTNSVMGYFFSNLTPMATGGQPFQIFHLISKGIDNKVATNVIFSRLVEYTISSLLLVLIMAKTVLDIVMEINVSSKILIAFGFALSLGMGALISLFLFRPSLLGAFVKRLEGSVLVRVANRFSRKKNVAERFHAWSGQLEESIAFLWKEKLPVILLDIALSLFTSFLQAFSLWALFALLISPSVDLMSVFAAFVMLNVVVYYIPTPGASGSIEGAYALTFSVLTGNWEETFVCILIWRFSTYYLHILFGILYLYAWRPLVDRLSARRGIPS